MLPPPTSVPAPDPSSPPSQVEEAGEQTWQVQGYHQTLQPELGMCNHELTICWAHRWISAEHTRVCKDVVGPSVKAFLTPH